MEGIPNEDDIEAVEEMMGMARFAWDMVDHLELLRCCHVVVESHYCREETKKDE